MIDKYLKTLLKDNKRVIIPDFGGFVVKRTSSGDVISFNGFLKFNDDLLATQVSEGEGVDKDQAMRLIREEVEKVNVVLDESGSFELKKLGFLVKDRKGNVRFMDKLGVAAFEAEKLKVADDKTQEPEKVKEDKPISFTPNSALEIDEDKSDLVEDATSVVEPVPDIQDVKVKKSAVQSKNKYLIPLIALVVIIFFVVSWFLFLKPKLVNELKQGQEVVVSEMVDDIIKGDDVIIGDDFEKVSLWKRISAVFKRDSTKNIEEDAEGDVEDVIEGGNEVASKDITSSKVEFAMMPLTEDTISGVYVLADKNISVKGEEKYNIIIGAFKEHKNAVALSKTLRSDNYGSQIFDRYNGFEAVSLGGFPSLDIALRVSGENIKKYPGLWILVK